jgi:hypothetical protein
VRDTKLGAGGHCSLKERMPGARLLSHRKVSPIMPPFLHFHALAAPRGDGLRPELLALFKRFAAVREPDLTVIEFDRHLADAVAQSGPHRSPDEGVATPEKPVKDMALGVAKPKGHVPSVGH